MTKTKGDKMDVLSFGEILFDVYTDENRAVIGGAPFNFARYYALTSGKAYLLSAVGNDEPGKAAQNECDKAGVKRDFLLTTSFPTGTVEVTLDENKVPSYTFKENTAYHNIVPDEEVYKKIKNSSAEILSFGTLIQCSAANRRTLDKLIALKEWKEIFCDINIRDVCKVKEYVETCLKNATVLKFSKEEERIFEQLNLISGDDAIAELNAKYPNIKIALRTLGAEGSLCYDLKNGKKYFCPAEKIEKVVTTVGAGDSYGAAFLASYASGKSIPESMKIATATSARVIGGKIR